MPNLGNKQLDADRCPHCAVDKPNLVYHNGGETTAHSGANLRVWALYYCRGCGGMVLAASTEEGGQVKEMYPSAIKETFDFSGIPKEVADDFQEALTCYSNLCFNAFGAMCRRTVQSLCNELGAKGKAKVMKQLKDARDIITDEIDEDTYEILTQIVIQGHDGAHPHLPKLSSERASILLQLMKDVLYQMYVRKKKLRQSIESRRGAVSEAKTEQSNET